MKANILGYGLMGSQIASLLLCLGYEVYVYSRNIPTTNIINKNNKINGKLLGFEYNNEKIYFSNKIDDLFKSAITIETISEDLNEKINIYKKVSNYLSGEYYSNTSSFCPSEIGDFVGALHFFNPINLKLVEYLTLSQHSKLQLYELLDRLQHKGFSAIKVNNNRGYLANSLIFREISNVFYMIEKLDYDIFSIESIYENLYKGRNIFDLIDLIGVDTSISIINNLGISESSLYKPKLLKLAFDNGVLGKKNKTSIKFFLKNIKY